MLPVIVQFDILKQLSEIQRSKWPSGTSTLPEPGVKQLSRLMAVNGIAKVSQLPHGLASMLSIDMHQVKKASMATGTAWLSPKQNKTKQKILVGLNYSM